MAHGPPRAPRRGHPLGHGVEHPLHPGPAQDARASRRPARPDDPARSPHGGHDERPARGAARRVAARRGRCGPRGGGRDLARGGTDPPAALGTPRPVPDHGALLPRRGTGSARRCDLRGPAGPGAGRGRSRAAAARPLPHHGPGLAWPHGHRDPPHPVADDAADRHRPGRRAGRHPGPARLRPLRHRHRRWRPRGRAPRPRRRPRRLCRGSGRLGRSRVDPGPHRTTAPVLRVVRRRRRGLAARRPRPAHRPCVRRTPHRARGPIRHDRRHRRRRVPPPGAHRRPQLSRPDGRRWRGACRPRRSQPPRDGGGRPAHRHQRWAGAMPPAGAQRRAGHRLGPRARRARGLHPAPARRDPRHGADPGRAGGPARWRRRAPGSTGAGATLVVECPGARQHPGARSGRHRRGRRRPRLGRARRSCSRGCRLGSRGGPERGGDPGRGPRGRHGVRAGAHRGAGG